MKMLRDRIVEKIHRITEISELEQLALEIKTIYANRKSAERAELLSRLNSRRENLLAPCPASHVGPDGTLCDCTAEDRRYGCGCR